VRILMAGSADGGAGRSTGSGFGFAGSGFAADSASDGRCGSPLSERGSPAMRSVVDASPGARRMPWGFWQLPTAANAPVATAAEAMSTVRRRRSKACVSMQHSLD
jgi:hypothetical protein